MIFQTHVTILLSFRRSDWFRRLQLLTHAPFSEKILLEPNSNPIFIVNPPRMQPLTARFALLSSFCCLAALPLYSVGVSAAVIARSSIEGRHHPWTTTENESGHSDHTQSLFSFPWSQKKGDSDKVVSGFFFSVTSTRPIFIGSDFVHSSDAITSRARTGRS